MEEILIPRDRIGVLNRSAIEAITKASGARLERRDCLIIVSGDGMEAYNAALVVKAVGRGFAPVRALKILKEMRLEIIRIQGSATNVARIKSRLIGTNGKARRKLEHLSGCMVSVYGNTVSLIGPEEKMPSARKAIEMLISGASHNTAYMFLEKSADIE